MSIAITSNDVLKELGISRSTFYYLLKNNLISISTTETGRYVWDEESMENLRKIIKLKEASEKAEEPKFKTTKINNRRYLGNKYKLLDFITSTVERECVGVNTIADILRGQGLLPPHLATKS